MVCIYPLRNNRCIELKITEELYLKPLILADGGFALTTTMINPYPGDNLSNSELTFEFNNINHNPRDVVNKLLSKCRAKLTVNKFRMLKGPIDFGQGKQWENKVANLILTGFILHNLCIDYKCPFVYFSRFYYILM